MSNAQGRSYGNKLAAADHGNEKFVKLLLSKGADINAKSEGGRYGTVLHAACQGL